MENVWFALKGESCHDVNLVLVGDTGVIKYDNLRCYHWLQGLRVFASNLDSDHVFRLMPNYYTGNI